MYLYSSYIFFLLFTPIFTYQNLEAPLKGGQRTKGIHAHGFRTNAVYPPRQHNKGVEKCASCTRMSQVKNEKKINSETVMLIQVDHCDGHFAAEGRSAEDIGITQRDQEINLVRSARIPPKPVKSRLFRCFSEKRVNYLHFKKTIQAAFQLRDFYKAVKEHFGSVQFNFVSDFRHDDRNLFEAHESEGCHGNDTDRTTRINLFISDKWDFSQHSKDVPRENILEEALRFFSQLLIGTDVPSQCRVIANSLPSASDNVFQTRKYSADKPLEESKINGRRRATRSVRKSVSSKKKEKVKEVRVCCTKFDAAANIRGELYLFKNEQFWRIGPNMHFDPGTTSNFWRDFPKVKLDAVYSYDAYIYFFAGKKVFVYFGNSPHPDQPTRELADFGLPSSLENIDAVYISYDHAYFFQGKQYWKYHLKTEQMKPTYPRNISDIYGMPSNLDAAVTNPFDDCIYFIKGRKWWRLNTSSIGVEDGYPQRIGPWWAAREDEISNNRTDTTGQQQTPRSRPPTPKRRPDAVQTSTTHHPAEGGAGYFTSSILVYFLSSLVLVVFSL